jgi:hypothetical protein
MEQCLKTLNSQQMWIFNEGLIHKQRYQVPMIRQRYQNKR